MISGLKVFAVAMFAGLSVAPAWALDVSISEILQGRIGGFVQEHFDGGQALLSIEATMLSNSEGEWVSGYSLRTAAVADTTHGQSLLVYFQNDNWTVRQEYTWVGIELRGQYERVSLGDSVEVDLGRALLKSVESSLKVNEVCFQVKRHRQRRFDPKWGADPATHTHEILTANDPPCCQSGRMFALRVDRGSIEVESVGDWVF